jgi:hypothetical protein
MHVAKAALPIAFVLSLASCHSAGPYGHAVNYAPLSDEQTAIKGARDYDPVMFQRRPDEWRKGTVSLFGVVTNRSGGQGGGAYITLSVRRLEPRNLCENGQDEDTCLVTVSDADFGVVHAQIAFKGDDDVGEHSVAGGSLLRLVGTFGEDVDPNDGAPILRGTYYRHWPRYFFTTKASASQMRQ